MRNFLDDRWKAKGLMVTEPSRVHIDASFGEGCTVGAFCEIGPITLGDRVTIDSHCCITGRIKIGQDVKIGASVTILGDITIGDQAVIGVGSVILRDIPPGETWAGNPARKLETQRTRGGK